MEQEQKNSRVLWWSSFFLKIKSPEDECYTPTVTPSCLQQETVAALELNFVVSAVDKVLQGIAEGEASAIISDTPLFTIYIIED